MKQKTLLTTISAIGLAAGTSQAAIVSFTDAFAGSTASGSDDSAATETAHSLSYNETNPSTSGGTTEIRTQDGPFNNGGTLFLATLTNEANSATYLASTLGDPGDLIWDTSSALTLTADVASNFDAANVTSGFMLEGATSGLIVSWNPAGTTYSAGLSALSTTIPTGVVNGSTFAGSASAPTGTALAAVTLSLIENGANYDFTLTMGGTDNTFSVAQASLGDIQGIGFYNGTNTTGGGNTNIDNVTLNGVTAPVPEPSSTALLGLGGLALILRRRK